MRITTSSARRKTGLAAAAVVVAGGAVAGGVAVAQAATPTTTAATPTATATATASPSVGGTTGDTAKGKAKDKAKAKGLRAGAIARLKGVQHATWVTEGKNGTFVTHDAIHGAVTAISPTSVTVKAVDGVSQTYTVTKDTKITLGQGHGTKPKAGATTDVATGADVVVSGTGSGTTLTAERLVVPKS